MVHYLIAFFMLLGTILFAFWWVSSGDYKLVTEQIGNTTLTHPQIPFYLRLWFRLRSDEQLLSATKRSLRKYEGVVCAYPPNFWLSIELLRRGYRWNRFLQQMQSRQQYKAWRNDLMDDLYLDLNHRM